MNVFLCGAAEIGMQTCWYCDGPVPPHVTDRKFCSHECATDHAAEIGDGPCTICGSYPWQHSTEHPYFPFGADPEMVYQACGGDK